MCQATPAGLSLVSNPLPQPLPPAAWSIQTTTSFRSLSPQTASRVYLVESVPVEHLYHKAGCFIVYTIKTISHKHSLKGVSRTLALEMSRQCFESIIRSPCFFFFAKTNGVSKKATFAKFSACSNPNPSPVACDNILNPLSLILEVL